MAEDHFFRREMTPTSILAAFPLLIGIAIPSVLHGQTIGDRYAIGVSFIKNWKSSCPAFVSGVYPKSPAARAGLRSGDKLLKVNGTDASSLDPRQVATSVGSDHPGDVSLVVERRRSEIAVTLTLEKYSAILADNGLRIAGDAILPIDEPASEQAEKEGKLRFDPDHVEFRIFPLHYPADLNRFYGGFEVYVLRNPAKTIVGGMEISPASRAGLHWGDTILAVDDVPLAGKSLSELERLFASDHAKLTRLTIDRNSSEKVITYTLAKAVDILQQNDKTMYKDDLIPAGVAGEDLHCFDKPDQSR